MNNDTVTITMTKAQAAVVGVLIGGTCTHDIEVAIRNNEYLSEEAKKFTSRGKDIFAVYNAICRMFEGDARFVDEDGEVTL